MESLPPPTVCHSLHQKHELMLVPSRATGFLCGGCKQFGQGPEHYRCEACDFHLHARCATAPAVVDHALFDTGSFTLSDDHTAAISCCHACAAETVGLRYHNPDLNLYLHPCCAFLPKSVHQDDHAFELRNDAYHKCRMCKERSRTPSLSYRCKYRHGGGHAYLHVRCLVKYHTKQTGHKNWHAGAPITKGVLGTFTRKRDAAMSVLGVANVAITVTGIVATVLAMAGGEEVDLDEDEHGI